MYPQYPIFLNGSFVMRKKATPPLQWNFFQIITMLTANEPKNNPKGLALLSAAASIAETSETRKQAQRERKQKSREKKKRIEADVKSASDLQIQQTAKIGKPVKTGMFASLYGEVSRLQDQQKYVKISEVLNAHLNLRHVIHLKAPLKNKAKTSSGQIMLSARGKGKNPMVLCTYV